MDIGPSHKRTRRAQTPQSLATGWLRWEFPSHDALLLSSLESSIAFVRQPASPWLEQGPGVPGCSLFLAHT